MSEPEFFFKMREGLWKNFYHYPEVDSTNLIAEYFIENGVSSGIVMADTQTAGRGRLTHIWNSFSDKNIYISFFGKCKSIDTLPLSIAVAIKMTADSFADNSCSFLKWPNDLLINKGKAAGFLGRTFERNGSLFYIAGIGFNVVKPDIDVFPISPSGLNDISEKKSDKKDVAVKLKEIFQKTLEMEKSMLLDRMKIYLEWMINKKTEVSFDGNNWEDAVIKGFTADFSAVVIQTETGTVTTSAVSIGEIV